MCPPEIKYRQKFKNGMLSPGILLLPDDLQASRSNNSELAVRDDRLRPDQRVHGGADAAPLAARGAARASAGLAAQRRAHTRCAGCLFAVHSKCASDCDQCGYN